MHDQDEKFNQTDLNLCLILLYFILSLLGDLVVGAGYNKQQEIIVKVSFIKERG